MSATKIGDDQRNAEVREDAAAHESSGKSEIIALESENASLREQNARLLQQDRVKEALIAQLKQELALALKRGQGASECRTESETNTLTTSALLTSAYNQALEVYEDNVGYTVALAMYKSQNEFMAKRMNLKNQDNEIEYTIYRLKDQWDNGAYKRTKW